MPEQNWSSYKSLCSLKPSLQFLAEVFCSDRMRTYNGQSDLKNWNDLLQLLEAAQGILRTERTYVILSSYWHPRTQSCPYSSSTPLQFLSLLRKKGLTCKQSFVKTPSIQNDSCREQVQRYLFSPALILWCFSDTNIYLLLHQEPTATGSVQTAEGSLNKPSLFLWMWQQDL